MMAVCERCQHFDGVTSVGIRCVKGGSTVLVNKRKTRCKQFLAAGSKDVERVDADAYVDDQAVMFESAAVHDQPRRIQGLTPPKDSELRVRLKASASVNRHGFKAIKASEIPTAALFKENAKNAWIRDVLNDFCTSKDEAWEIDKDYGDSALDALSARNLAGAMRKQIVALSLPCKALKRSDKVYLQKEECDAHE